MTQRLFAELVRLPERRHGSFALARFKFCRPQRMQFAEPLV